jgi:hypothetical protein
VSEIVNKGIIIGWIVQLVGTALWIYGYFVTGHPSFIDWHAHTPWWIADFLPNIESEIGMALVCAALVPIYWPAQRWPDRAILDQALWENELEKELVMPKKRFWPDGFFEPADERLLHWDELI